MPKNEIPSLCGVVRCLDFSSNKFFDIYIVLFSIVNFSSQLKLNHRETPPPPEGVENSSASAEPLPGGLSDADIESNWEESIEAFDGMDLPEELLRGIYAYGFEKPSAIQQRAIKPTMNGKDLIAQAQSGTVRIIITLIYPMIHSFLFNYRHGDDDLLLTIFRV